MEEDDRRKIALFRYLVIAPLLALEPERGARKREIERLSQRVWEHPTRGEIRIAFGTIEEWLYAYRRGGLDALMPVPRTDRKKSRAIDDMLAEKIEALATSRPELDGPGILAELKVDVPGRLPSLSALYRFLRARGLQSRRSPQRQDHRAYAFELAGDCWQCDVMYGPAIPTRDGKRRKTYLIVLHATAPGRSRSTDGLAAGPSFAAAPWSRHGAVSRCGPRLAAARGGLHAHRKDRKRRDKPAWSRG